jgi:hypothetical protein
MASQWPKGAIIAGIPLILVGVAVMQRRIEASATPGIAANWRVLRATRT